MAEDPDIDHQPARPDSETGPAGADLGSAPPASPTGGKARRWLLVTGVVLAVLIVIVVALAGGSYWWFTAKVQTSNERIDPQTERALETPPPTTLVSVPPPADMKNPPIDIVLLGSDTRAGTLDTPGSSDVIMLLHVDRDQDFLSIMSVTRDLYVDIPGYYKDRINAAYYLGGPPLSITTIKHVLGIDVTKYVEVGFTSFEEIVDSLGGIYVDVDRRYTPIPRWDGDLYPGYQLLDGAQALSFARYRFDGNGDFGRMARQQRIMAAARDRAATWSLPTKLPGIVDGLLSSAKTNLTANELLKLAYWLVKLDGSRIKQTLIKGVGDRIHGKAVVVVEREALAEAVTDFLTPPEETPVDIGGEPADEVLLAAAEPERLLAAAQTAMVTEATLPDAAMWAAAQATVPFGLEAPRFIPEGFAYVGKVPADGGSYGIRVGAGTRPAVRMIYRYRRSDLYLGITATTWTDAPIAGEGREVDRNGVIYTLVGTSGKVDHIWWEKDGVLYFISNTIMHTVERDELLKMAESMTPVGVPVP
jgi:LCP family protein required for cell wall assembly